MRKPTIWVSDLVRHKLVCAVTEISYKLELSDLTKKEICFLSRDFYKECSCLFFNITHVRSVRNGRYAFVKILNLNGLLVTRQIDNTSPGGTSVPGSHRTHTHQTF